MAPKSLLRGGPCFICIILVLAATLTLTHGQVLSEGTLRRRPFTSTPTQQMQYPPESRARILSPMRLTSMRQRLQKQPQQLRLVNPRLSIGGRPLSYMPAGGLPTSTYARFQRPKQQQQAQQRPLTTQTGGRVLLSNGRSYIVAPRTTSVGSRTTRYMPAGSTSLLVRRRPTSSVSSSLGQQPRYYVVPRSSSSNPSTRTALRTLATPNGRLGASRSVRPATTTRLATSPITGALTRVATSPLRTVSRTAANMRARPSRQLSGIPRVNRVSAAGAPRGARVVRVLSPSAYQQLLRQRQQQQQRVRTASTRPVPSTGTQRAQVRQDPLRLPNELHQQQLRLQMLLQQRNQKRQSQQQQLQQQQQQQDKLQPSVSVASIPSAVPPQVGNQNAMLQDNSVLLPTVDLGLSSMPGATSAQEAGLSDNLILRAGEEAKLKEAVLGVKSSDLTGQPSSNKDNMGPGQASSAPAAVQGQTPSVPVILPGQSETYVEQPMNIEPTAYRPPPTPAVMPTAGQVSNMPTAGDIPATTAGGDVPAMPLEPVMPTGGERAPMPVEPVMPTGGERAPLPVEPVMPTGGERAPMPVEPVMPTGGERAPLPVATVIPAARGASDMPVSPTVPAGETPTMSAAGEAPAIPVVPVMRTGEAPVMPMGEVPIAPTMPTGSEAPTPPTAREVPAMRVDPTIPAGGEVAVPATPVIPAAGEAPAMPVEPIMHTGGAPAMPTEGVYIMPTEVPAMPTGGAPTISSGGAPAMPTEVPAMPTGGAPTMSSGGAPAMPTEGAPIISSGGVPAMPTEVYVMPTEVSAMPTGGAPAMPTERAYVMPAEVPAMPTGGAPAMPTGGAPTMSSGGAPAMPTEGAPTMSSGGVPAMPTEGAYIMPVETVVPTGGAPAMPASGQASAMPAAIETSAMPAAEEAPAISTVMPGAGEKPMMPNGATVPAQPTAPVVRTFDPSAVQPGAPPESFPINPALATQQPPQSPPMGLIDPIVAGDASINYNNTPAVTDIAAQPSPTLPAGANVMGSGGAQVLANMSSDPVVPKSIIDIMMTTAQPAMEGSGVIVTEAPTAATAGNAQTLMPEQVAGHISPATIPPTPQTTRKASPEKELSEQAAELSEAASDKKSELSLPAMT